MKKVKKKTKQYTTYKQCNFETLSNKMYLRYFIFLSIFAFGNWKKKGSELLENYVLLFQKLILESPELIG